MRERVNHNHDTLTNSIPLELVGSVFQFCVPEKWKFEELKETSIRKTAFGKTRRMVSGPLSLGSICKTWRNIAWSTKPLWTVFTLHIDDLNNPNKLVLTKEWLERAGQLPLSIRILVYYCRSLALPKHEVGKAKQLIAVINEQSNQWEHLDILGPSWLIPQINGGPGGAPNLQALRIISRDLGNVAQTKIALIDAMPRPSRLNLSGFPLSRVHIEWTHLTHVCIDLIDLDESIELPRRATNLIYCKIELIFPDMHRFPIPDEPIIYRALTSLELGSISKYSNKAPKPMMFFFKSFIFPNLKHLIIQSGGSRKDFHDQVSWAPLVAHIVNFPPPLLSLNIRNLGPHPISECVIPILQTTPLLRDLEMMAPFVEEWDGEENEFLQLLANTSNSNNTLTNFLPNLRSIKFHLSPEQDPDRFWNSIPRMFGPIRDIHNPHRRPLKTVRVRTVMHSLIESADVVLQLLRLRQEGIFLDLKTIDERIDVLERSIERHGHCEWPGGTDDSTTSCN